MKRPQCSTLSWIISWLWKSSKTHQQHCRLESLRIFFRVDQRWKITSHKKTVLGYNVTRRTLSSSSSSNLPSSTSMTPSKQELDHPTSSSSSSTSPTMTSCSVSNDSETKAMENLNGMDSHPITVSYQNVERQERGDLFTKPTKNP